MSFGFQVQGSEYLHSHETTFPIHNLTSKPDRATSSSSLSTETRPINGQDPIHTSLPTVSSAVDLSHEALGDLITTISELYEEHVPAVNVRLRFNRAADLVSLQRGEKVATITSLSGTNVTVEELSEKLERFKVRTIEVGGVVKEGINRQACIEIDSPGSRWFIHSA